MYALDYLEGNLTEEERVDFEKFLMQNPQIKSDFASFTLVTLPEPPVWVYKNKSKLYQKPAGIKGMIVSMSSLQKVAAAILLCVGVYFILNQYHKGTLEENTGLVEVSQNKMGKLSPNDQAIQPMEPLSDNVYVEPSLKKEQGPDRVTLARENSDHKPFHRPNTTPIESLNTEVVLEEDPMDSIFKNELAEEIAAIPVITQVAELPTVKPSNLEIRKVKDLNQYRWSSSSMLPHKNKIDIHIPGEFLSDTWSDLSFNHIKEKILPEFIKN